jgi:hypothetical protein
VGLSGSGCLASVVCLIWREPDKNGGEGNGGFSLSLGSVVVIRLNDGRKKAFIGEVNIEI